MKYGWRETTNDDHILFFVFSLFLHPTSSGPMKGRCNCLFFFFSWNFFLIWPLSSDQVERSRQPEKKKGRRGWAKNTWTWFCKYFISCFCILNYFNISTQVRRIREAQEEERRRKLEELKQHVRFFMLFFIGPKSDHFLALSVSQSVHLLAEICPNWICKAEANTKFWQLVWLAGSTSAEVPWAAGGVEKETHWRVEEQRHGQEGAGLSISWKTFLRIKIIR